MLFRSFAGEISALIMEQAFDALDAPVMRVASAEVPIPYAKHLEEAATRLAAILTEESTDVLTVYDEHGGYGHPDHIQVHRVGIRAAEIAGVDDVFEATIDRDHLIALMRARPVELGADSPLPDDPDDLNLGVAGHLITTRIDITPVIERKRAAMRAHASQIPADSFFLTLPDDAYAMAFGTEWFTRRGAPAGTAETALPL